MPSLLTRLFRRPGHKIAGQGPLTPPQPQETLYVIGDIHGRRDLVTSLLGQIEKDVAARTIPDARLVFVGDYIDRGDESAAVLFYLYQLWSEADGQVICLLGNHERMMLDFLDHPDGSARRWLSYGGLQTLASFNLGGGLSETSSASQMVSAAQALRAALGDGIERWLRSLPLVYNSGNIWVTHAGADPALPMPDQSRQSLLWGHKNFSGTPRTDGQWVAHGHTIFDQPEVRDGRIAVDTGAFFSGRLTAARLSPSGEHGFVST